MCSGLKTLSDTSGVLQHRWQHKHTVKKLLQAPNLALATLWADQLSGVGIAACVQRAFACGIVGQIPPDQALPEVWVQDDDEHARAAALLHEWRHRPHRRWLCHGCGESVEGPFEQCWNCGAMDQGHSGSPAPA